MDRTLQPPNPDSSWISVQCWDNLCEMEEGDGGREGEDEGTG